MLKLRKRRKGVTTKRREEEDSSCEEVNERLPKFEIRDVNMGARVKKAVRVGAFFG